MRKMAYGDDEIIAKELSKYSADQIFVLSQFLFQERTKLGKPCLDGKKLYLAYCRLVQGKTLSEIAKEEGVPPSAIERRIIEAIRKMRWNLRQGLPILNIDKESKIKLKLFVDQLFGGFTFQIQDQLYCLEKDRKMLNAEINRTVSRLKGWDKFILRDKERISSLEKQRKRINKTEFALKAEILKIQGK